MKLVEQHIIRKNNINYKTIEDLSIKSNNLYNTALFIIRQHYFNRKGKQFISDICNNVDYDYVNYYDLNRILKQTNNNDYKALPANVSQETLKLVDKNFKSFFKLVNKKKNKEYESKIKLNASGKRIKRGLYQTKNSHYINADINGSFNIMRKYLNVASDHILNGRCRGFVVNPYLVTFK